MQRVRKNLSYANVMSTLAVILAVAGGTTAIAGSKAPKNSVTSKSITDGSVTAKDLARTRVETTQGPDGIVRCKRDERLLSGGAEAIPAPGDSTPAYAQQLTASEPTADGTGWQGKAVGPNNLSLSAICLKAKPGR